MTLHNPLPLFGTSVARRRFNSRAREGRDKKYALASIHYEFQFTRP